MAKVLVLRLGGLSQPLGGAVFTRRLAGGRFGVGSGRFDKLSPGRAASPNSGSTRPNRRQLLDCEGIGFAVARLTQTLAR
jgi:hypothetical protein